MKDVKWGIIGTGRIAHKFAAALKECEGAVLFAVGSRNVRKARAYADEFGFENAYGSYAELAQGSGVDAVYIATPMASHFADAKLCLENGINVLCEKTVTLNCAQLEELLEIAQAKGLLFMEAMWMKCLPLYLQVKKLVGEGAIGKVLQVKADFSNFVPYDAGDRLFRADCGGGALLDMTVYPLTFAAAFLGNEPSEVISQAHITRGIDMSNTVLLRYQGGACASVYSGFELALKNNALIIGEKGSVVMGDCFFCTDSAVIYDENGKEKQRIELAKRVNGYEYEILEFMRCLAQGRTDSELVPGCDTLAVLRILDECRRQWGLTFEQELL